MKSADWEVLPNVLFFYHLPPEAYELCLSEPLSRYLRAPRCHVTLNKHPLLFSACVSLGGGAEVMLLLLPDLFTW